MNESHFEFRVGVFVLIGVTLLALLILNFSKGATLSTPPTSCTSACPTPPA